MPQNRLKRRVLNLASIEFGAIARMNDRRSDVEVYKVSTRDSLSVGKGNQGQSRRNFKQDDAKDDKVNSHGWGCYLLGCTPLHARTVQLKRQPSQTENSGRRESASPTLLHCEMRP